MRNWSFDEKRPISVLRIDEVMRRTGLRRTMLYQKVREGEFPQQVSLGARAVGWIDKEVDEWILTRGRARFAAQMEAAREVMRENRDVLQKLAE